MLSKEKEMELREKIKFNERGEIANQEALDDWIQETINTYYESINWDNPYYEGKGWDNPYADEHHLPEDNKLLEEISVIIFSESIKDRKQRGIDTKGEPKTIDKISPNDIGINYKFKESYQLNNKRIPVDKVSLSDERPDSNGNNISYQYDEYCYNQWKDDLRNNASAVVDRVFNQITESYYRSDETQQKYMLYHLIVHIHDNYSQLDKEFYRGIRLFLDKQLSQFSFTNAQKKLLNKIFMYKLTSNGLTSEEKRMIKRVVGYKKILHQDLILL